MEREREEREREKEREKEKRERKRERQRELYGQQEANMCFQNVQAARGYTMKREWWMQHWSRLWGLREKPRSSNLSNWHQNGELLLLWALDV
jgi:hypothetical protein